MLLKIIRMVFFFGLLVVLGYLLFRLGEKTHERYLLTQQMKEVELRVSALQKNTEELKLLLAQLGNEEFLKLKLKEELNVKEEGEQVALIRLPKSSPEEGIKGERREGLTHYLAEWWNLFFGAKTSYEPG